MQYQQGDIHSQQMLVLAILLWSGKLRSELAQVCLRVVSREEVCLPSFEVVKCRLK